MLKIKTVIFLTARIALTAFHNVLSLALYLIGDGAWNYEASKSSTQDSIQTGLKIIYWGSWLVGQSVGLQVV